MAAEAAAYWVLLIPVCCRSSALGKLCLVQELGTRETVHWNSWTWEKLCGLQRASEPAHQNRKGKSFFCNVSLVPSAIQWGNGAGTRSEISQSSVVFFCLFVFTRRSCNFKLPLKKKKNELISGKIFSFLKWQQQQRLYFQGRNYVLTKSSEDGNIISMLQIKKVRLREVKWFT